MFGLFKRTETASGRVDVAGELYSAFFGFGGSNYSWISPAVLAASHVDPWGIGTLLTESRRLAKIRSHG